MNPSLRPLMSVEKLEKVQERFENMVKTLQSSCSISLHRNVDQFFYMQKVAEFTTLKEQLEAALRTLQDIQQRAYTHYSLAYTVWRKDMRLIRATHQHSVLKP